MALMRVTLVSYGDIVFGAIMCAGFAPLTAWLYARKNKRVAGRFVGFGVACFGVTWCLLGAATMLDSPLGDTLVRVAGVLGLGGFILGMAGAIKLRRTHQGTA